MASRKIIGRASLIKIPSRPDGSTKKDISLERKYALQSDAIIEPLEGNSNLAIRLPPSSLHPHWT